MNKAIQSILIGAGILLSMFPALGKETVPYKSQTVGQLTYLDNGGVTVQETGIGTHLGSFTLIGETDENGILWFTVTCASKDELYGVVVAQSGEMLELLVYDGTGRFIGVTGTITVTMTVDPNPISLSPLVFGYTAVTSGTISTVGSGEK